MRRVGTLAMADIDAITRLLNRSLAGDEEASSTLWDHVHSELGSLARGHMAREGSEHTLQATALVHEAWMRLVGAKDAGWKSRGHFYAMASKIMRQILVDHARGKKAEKRGGGLGRVPLEGAAGDEPGTSLDPIDLLDLHDALDALAEVDAERAQLLELRYFGGLQIAEIAEASGLPVRTVERRLAAATGWVRQRVARGGGD